VACVLLFLALLPVAVPSDPEQAWLVDLTLDLDSPDAVATFMRRKFTFRHDEELYGVPEYFATPQEFLTRGAGDCDDWAWFAAEALRERGFATWLMSVWRPEPDDAGNTGHMVAAYLTREGWSYVSSDGHVPAHASSIAGLAAAVSPKWDGVSIWRFTGVHHGPSPWNGWRPSVWVPNLHEEDGGEGAFRAAERFRLRFRRGGGELLVSLAPAKRVTRR
jgi:Transglutaminase-like superfamily